MSRARTCRATIVVALVALVVATAAPTRAQSTPSFFPERYAACRAPRVRSVAPEEPSTRPEPAWIPITRRRAPPRLPMAPLVTIDVAIAAPVPARPSAPEPAPAPPTVVVQAAPQDWRCIGFTRGRAGVLRVVGAPPLARFADHDDAESWRLANVRAASAAGWAEAVPALRRILARPVPSTEGPELFDALDAKLNAARALGDLGDRGSAASFSQHLAAREDASYSTLWNDGWFALEAMDPDAAETYAADVVARVRRGRAPSDPHAASDDSLLRAALPRLRTPHPERLALVRSLPRSDERCDLLAARLRLGDDALLRELRPDLATELRTQRGAVCYGDLMPFAFPGKAPDEVETLLHRHRLEAILDLLERARAAPKDEATWRKALDRLRDTLHERSNDPDVAGDPTDRRSSPVRRALHLAALAELGDAKARADAERLAADPHEDGIAPWVAISVALRFGWPGAEDLAAARLASARQAITQRYDTDLEPLRGFFRLNDHIAVVDALAARRDPRFALGLLDREQNVREATALHVARRGDRATCDVVMGAAPGAEEKSVQDAYWILSMLGDQCREQAHRQATDANAPPHVRGMALELLAMMRDPRAKPLLRDHGARDPIRAARGRARIIYEAPE